MDDLCRPSIMKVLHNYDNTKKMKSMKKIHFLSNRRVRISPRLKYRREYVHTEDEGNAWNAKLWVSGFLE